MRTVIVKQDNSRSFGEGADIGVGSREPAATILLHVASQWRTMILSSG